MLYNFLGDIMTVEEHIKEIIDMIKPFLAYEGGNIEFIKYENNIVYIKMLGACADCVYVDDTISSSIESTIMEEIPEVKGVINLQSDSI